MTRGMDPGPDPIGELVADERRGGELLIARFRLGILFAFVPALFALRFFTGYLLPSYWFFSIAKWALMTLAAVGLWLLLRRGFYRPWLGFLTMTADTLFITVSVITLSFYTLRHAGMLQDPLVFMYYLVCLSGGVRAGVRYTAYGVPLCGIAVLLLARADAAFHGVAVDPITVTDRMAMLILVAAMGLVFHRKMQAFLFSRFRLAQKHVREISALLAIGRRLSSRDELARALDDIAGEAASLVRASQARIVLADDAVPGSLDALLFACAAASPGGVFTDVRTAEAALAAAMKGEGAAYCVVQPVMVEGAAAGVLFAVRGDGLAFDDHERALLGLLSAQAAIALKHARLIDRLAGESAYSGPDFAGEEQFQGIIGAGFSMKELFRIISKAAPASIPVLIRGESGTGKELVAAALQTLSPRRDRPFIKINCAAIPPDLLESELFGHERGAFTGADRLRRGALERAAGGTLFLDEIGDMDVKLQAKILRVLQEGVFERLGGETTLRIDVRVITATNQDLEAKIRRGEFREDLYYRISGLPITVPPLRERREDIPSLVDHFVRRHEQPGARPVEFTVGAMRYLAARQWRGNVRELENVVHRTMIMSDGERVSERYLKSLMDHADTASLADFHDALRRYTEERVREGCDLPQEADRMEREFLAEALRQTDGSLRKAAGLLGIPKSTLFNRLQKHKLGGE